MRPCKDRARSPHAGEVCASSVSIEGCPGGGRLSPILSAGRGNTIPTKCPFPTPCPFNFPFYTFGAHIKLLVGAKLIWPPVHL